jgi:hypothetical protein
VFCSKDSVITKVPIKEHVPPDVTAQIFWLKNRDGARPLSQCGALALPPCGVALLLVRRLLWSALSLPWRHATQDHGRAGPPGLILPPSEGRPRLVGMFHPMANEAARRSDEVVCHVVLTADSNKGHVGESAGCRRHGDRIFRFDAQHLPVNGTPRFPMSMARW